MTTPMVLIPLTEYEELMRVKNELTTAFNKQKSILHLRQFYSGPSGYPANEYSIVNESEVVGLLNKELQLERTENNKLYRLHNEMKEQLARKKWYSF